MKIKRKPHESAFASNSSIPHQIFNLKDFFENNFLKNISQQ